MWIDIWHLQSTNNIGSRFLVAAYLWCIWHFRWQHICDVFDIAGGSEYKGQGGEGAGRGRLAVCGDYFPKFCLNYFRIVKIKTLFITTSQVGRRGTFGCCLSPSPDHYFNFDLAQVGRSSMMNCHWWSYWFMEMILITASRTIIQIQIQSLKKRLRFKLQVTVLIFRAGWRSWCARLVNSWSLHLMLENKCLL